MARSARGLPEGFSLDLPDEKPTVIGDFLDEEPPALPVKRAPKRRPKPATDKPTRSFASP